MMRNSIQLILITFLLLTWSCSAPSKRPKKEDLSELVKEWEGWKTQRLEALNAKDGWNNLVGLYWVEVGENDYSTKEKSFDLKSAVDYRASFFRGLNDQVFLTLRGGGVEFKDSLIFDAEAGLSAEVSFESVSFHLIKRDDQIGIRMREFDRFPLILSIPSFGYNAKWRIPALFEEHKEVKLIPFQNVLGMTIQYESPGALSFNWEGDDFTLDVIESDDNHFVIFSDETSAVTTYGAGRYLYVSKVQEGAFVIDFNRSQNPPCAFTAFATCLLPPEQNFLPFSVDAGEKDYHH